MPLNYLTTDRTTFNAKAEAKLAEYGRRVRQADADGAHDAGAAAVNDALDLSTGLDVVSRALSKDDARTSRILGYLVERHALDSVPASPFASVSVTLGLPGGPMSGPIYWADIVGLPSSSPALVSYITTRLSSVAAQPFTLRPTITTGGLQAGQVYTGTAEYMFRTQNEVYVAPTWTAFALDGQGSRTVEVGTLFADATRTFTWSGTQPANVQANSLSLLNVTTGATLATGQANDGTQAVLVPAFTATNGETRRFRLTGINTNAVSFSTELVLSGSYRLYFGPTGSAPTNSAQARALPSSQLLSEGNSATLTTGTTATRFAIVLPPGKTLQSATDLDNLNANILAAYVAQAPISVTDAAGVAVSGYTPYVLTAATPYSTSARHLLTF